MDKKWALVTGASSGIGREFCKELYKNGYSVIMVSRRYDEMVLLRENILSEFNYKNSDIVILQKDLSKKEDLYMIFDETKKFDVSILINNAGFGDVGEFYNTSLDKELEMINVNIRAVHFLTKKYLSLFLKKNNGYILNVSSSAGLMPAGPYMSTYYATKAYVTGLTSGIAKELRKRKSNVYIGSLCPGPVKTNFYKVANSNITSGINTSYCVQYALRKMFDRKEIIIPSLTMQTIVKLSKIVPRNILISICGLQQNMKIK